MVGRKAARPRPRTLPRKQGGHILAVPTPSTCPKSLLPRRKWLLKTSRKDLLSQRLSLAPAISVVLGQIQSPLVPSGKCLMSTKGKAKIPLDTNHLSYPQNTLLPYCLNSKDRPVPLPPPQGTTQGWLPLCLPDHTWTVQACGTAISPPSWQRKIFLAAEVQAQLALITFG